MHLNKNFNIRFAEKEDSALILDFIKQLAIYEKLEDQVVATQADIEMSIFTHKQAEVIIGEYNKEPIAFALYFHNYSTFLGKANLYLEDLFVIDKYRAKGFGKAMFTYLAKLAVARNCNRLDWWCLDWNQKSIDFYKKMGAIAMDDWTVYRLEGETLNLFAKDEH